MSTFLLNQLLKPNDNKSMLGFFYFHVLLSFPFWCLRAVLCSISGVQLLTVIRWHPNGDTLLFATPKRFDFKTSTARIKSTAHTKSAIHIVEWIRILYLYLRIYRLTPTQSTNYTIKYIKYATNKRNKESNSGTYAAPTTFTKPYKNCAPNIFINIDEWKWKINENVL